MVKIGALIGAFLVTLGSIFQIIIYIVVVSGKGTWQGLQAAVSLVDGRANAWIVIFTILYYLGIIIVLGSGFIKGKLFLKIGGGVMIFGILPVMVAWLIGELFKVPYNIGGIIMFLGAILYFIGCIQFKKHNIVTIFTGFFMLLSILASQIVIGIILMVILGESDSLKIVHFGSLIFQVIIFVIHSWIFGFSKKEVEYSDDVEDTLSIEKGQAFASYVPSDMKKKKKGKKPSENDDITFTF